MGCLSPAWQCLVPTINHSSSTIMDKMISKNRWKMLSSAITTIIQLWAETTSIKLITPVLRVATACSTSLLAKNTMLATTRFLKRQTGCTKTRACLHEPTPFQRKALPASRTAKWLHHLHRDRQIPSKLIRRENKPFRARKLCPVDCIKRWPICPRISAKSQYSTSKSKMASWLCASLTTPKSLSWPSQGIRRRKIQLKSANHPAIEMSLLTTSRSKKIQGISRKRDLRACTKQLSAKYLPTLD